MLDIYLTNTMYQLAILDIEMVDTEETSVIELKRTIEFTLLCKSMSLSSQEVEMLQDWLDGFSFEYKEIVSNVNGTEQMRKLMVKSIRENNKNTVIRYDTVNMTLDSADLTYSILYQRVSRRRDVPFSICQTLRFNVTWTGNDVKWGWHCDYKIWYTIEHRTIDHVAGADDILTYVCFSVSCASLLISFPLHRCSKISKTVPGKNMENLMLTLFLSQMSFLFGIGQEEKYLCMVAAILIHYFYLCCFSWMNLCMIHIMFILSRMKKYPNNSHNSGTTCSRLAPLVVIGYLLPACIVIPCALCEFVLDSSFKVGYTKHGICFPSNFPENVYVFVAPVCLSLLINILCLFRVIFIINTAVPEGFDKTKFRRYVPVYLKLTIVSGLSWLFGIVGEATGSAVLRYCFILFAGLQGLMLCISFVFTGSVWTDVKSRVLCCTEQEAMSTTVELTNSPSSKYWFGYSLQVQVRQTGQFSFIMIRRLGYI